MNSPSLDCDGIAQCEDKSDEHDGCVDECRGFTCADKSDCIAHSMKCDGHVECESDDSDEGEECLESTTTTTTTTITTPPPSGQVTNYPVSAVLFGALISIALMVL